MEKKDIDWANLGFGYVETDKRFVSNYTNGAWDDGQLISDSMITMSECACVLQYAQTIFEGLKAYRRADGQIQLFRHVWQPPQPDWRCRYMRKRNLWMRLRRW